jgi:hypothetical protein
MIPVVIDTNVSKKIPGRTEFMNIKLAKNVTPRS